MWHSRLALVGRWTQRCCGGSPLANPVLIAIMAIVALLETTGISYATDLNGSNLLRFLLGPATVALAFPIYQKVGRIRGAAPGIVAGVQSGRRSAVQVRSALPGYSGCPKSCHR
jgi:putative effector of murein hydrolase